MGLCGCKFVSQLVSEHAKPYSACCAWLINRGGFSMRGQFVGGACRGLDDVLPSVQSKIGLWMRNKADTWNKSTQNRKQAA